MRRPSLVTKAYWFQRVGKGVALTVSTCAALVSMTSALLGYGVIGRSDSHRSIGNLGAAWVQLRPGVDTAFAVGDTVHFAATVADKNGSILIGAKPTWTTGDTSIAVASGAGAIVARKPGQTTVTVVVGSHVATAQVVVKQRVAGVVLSSSAGDAAVAILEGDELQLRARAVDARGHTVQQAGAAWHIDDTTVATLDSTGVLSGRVAGRSVVSARIDGKAGYIPVAVITTAAQLAVVGGSGQRAPAGRMLPQPIVVRATNRRGEPAAGKRVTFRPAGTMGVADPAAVTTDADGRARTVWTLGEVPGRQMLAVTVENVDSAAVIIAESDPVAANTRVVAATHDLRAPAGQPLPDTLEISVTDSLGRALPDVPVQWTALDDGTVEPLAARTDSLGMARARWTLSSRAGVQRVRAHVGSGAASHSIAPVLLKATALPGAPARASVVSGDRQRGAAGSALKKPVVVRVLDGSGNGVADVPVVLSLSAGSVADSAPRTDSTGAVAVRWSLGRAARPHSLAVHVSGVKTLVKVTAVATPAAAANLSFEDAPAERGRTVTRGRRLYALVTDAYGNPVPDAPVTFSTRAGSVTPARAVTDDKGRVLVRWVPGTGDDQRLVGAVRSTDVRGTFRP